jgi:hypothetical protein
MELIRGTARIGYLAVSIATVIVVLFTAHVPRRADLLRYLTQENGVVEWGSVVVLVLIGLASMRALFLDRREPSLSATARSLLAALILVASLAALEEISWGQQVLGFRSSKFFLDHNLQRETNLHNLLPASISSSIINGAIYIFFLWIPCALRIAPTSRLAREVHSCGWDIFLPSFDTIIIFAFGSTLQAYFLLPTWSDSLALLVTLAFLGWMLSVQSTTRWQDWSNMAWVVLCAAVFAAHYDIFRFANMQYEIRELIVVLGCLHWITDWAPPPISPSTLKA